MVKSFFPWIKLSTWTWIDVVETIRPYKPRLHYHKVMWLKPGIGQAKCDTDGASRGNPGINSYGFCIRDDKGDLIYARAKGLGFDTNTVAEAMAIKEALEYCYDEDLRDFILETDSLSLKKTNFEAVENSLGNS